MSEIADVCMKGWVHEWVRENLDYMSKHSLEESNTKFLQDCYNSAMKALESIIEIAKKENNEKNT